MEWKPSFCGYYSGFGKPTLRIGIPKPYSHEGIHSVALLYLSGCGALSVRLTYINVVEVEQRSWLRYRGFTTIEVVQLGTMPQPPYSGGSLPLHLEKALARNI